MTDEVLDNPSPGASDATPVSDQSTNIVSAPEVAAPVAPQTWPDNWRQAMAGDDEKELKRLERMKSPNDVFKSYRELEKLKSGFTPPPKKPEDGATPEEVKAYRDYLGVPESHSGYDLKFDDGTAIGEDVMPHIEGFLKHAHANNMSPEVVKSSIKFYMDDIAQEQERISTLNYEAKINGIAELKSEWGGEYKGNINSIQSLFADAPEGTMDSLLNARGPDGLNFANNPANIKWLVGLAKTINPTASLLPSGANDLASIDTELDKLRTQMNSSDPVERNKYWKDPKAQERLLALTQAKQKAV